MLAKGDEYVTVSLRHYAKEAQNGSQEAMNIILKEFEPLIKKQVKKYYYNYQNFEEAKSSIHHAAIHCIMTFDLSEGKTVQQVLPGKISSLLDHEDYKRKKYNKYVQKNFADDTGTTDLPKDYAAPQEQRPEHRLLNREMHTLLSQALRTLSETEYRFIHCYYFKNQTYREIAQKYGVSKSKVGRIIQRGKENIRVELMKSQFSWLE